MGKVIITGPGRAGTSFLVRLLTRLGEDTGFTAHQEAYNEDWRAGCEHQIITDILDGELVTRKLKEAPRILKSPDWSLVLKHLVLLGWMEVDHVLIPFRDLDVSARSRLDVGLDWMVSEDSTGELRVQEQANIHAIALARTLEACWICGLPHTILMFPHLVQDGGYCYGRLSRAFTLDREVFDGVFAELARPEQVRWN